ncbi:FtsX-like permease family protein [Pirellulimonas nuda]|uniref:FtsX-like permease family protein n=2 Tax=Pirellulimonas nuda TaxID=2528009 RepID=A0A518D6E1_9BACT|nr:FtsX-like permease family protein [Pirellulimonas nuda]
MRLTGRLPIGWKQLLHNRTRLVAAVGGVTFANVLIFMQLGFMNALFSTSVMTHRTWDTDIVIAASDFRSLREANPVPRSRMYQALAVDGVHDATPLYLGTMFWTDPDTSDTTNFRVMGVDPDQRVFLDPALQRQVAPLRQPDYALVDLKTRDFPAAIRDRLEAGSPVRIEVSGRQLTLVGSFSQGATFDVDGVMITSDETFLRLFPRRRPGTPTVVLVRCDPGADPEAVARRLNALWPEKDVRAFTKQQLVEAEQSYQAKQTPIGFVFGFGVVIGLIVGLVIVYQVLATDVQDHMAEYATFKAIGYPPRFFLGVVFQEAVSLAALGFIPGLGISLVLYQVAARATSLPITMTLGRPIMVFVLTAVMCTISGAIATRRLNAADPADLF